jgi:hypothetical protein
VITTERLLGPFENVQGQRPHYKLVQLNWKELDLPNRTDEETDPFSNFIENIENRENFFNLATSTIGRSTKHVPKMAVVPTVFIPTTMQQGYWLAPVLLENFEGWLDNNAMAFKWVCQPTLNYLVMVCTPPNWG